MGVRGTIYRGALEASYRWICTEDERAQIEHARKRAGVLLAWASERSPFERGAVELALKDLRRDPTRGVIDTLEKFDHGGRIFAAVMSDAELEIDRAGIASDSRIGRMFVVGALAAAAGHGTSNDVNLAIDLCYAARRR